MARANVSMDTGTAGDLRQVRASLTRSLGRVPTVTETVNYLVALHDIASMREGQDEPEVRQLRQDAITAVKLASQ